MLNVYMTKVETEMTPEQNALLARLDGWSSLIEMNSVPDYDDLNNLMPLAWKHGLGIYEDSRNRGEGIVYVFGWECSNDNESIVTFDENPKTAIQQALLAIALEKYDE